MAGKLITVEQAATQLKLHPKTVLRHIREGRLMATRIGKSYRIEQDRLNAFSGQTDGPPAPHAGIRATCVIDAPGLDIGQAQRIATFLGAVGMTGDAETPPLHISTAFDPETLALKVVVIGVPADVARILEMLQPQMEQAR